MRFIVGNLIAAMTISTAVDARAFRIFLVRERDSKLIQGFDEFAHDIHAGFDHAFPELKIRPNDLAHFTEDFLRGLVRIGNEIDQNTATAEGFKSNTRGAIMEALVPPYLRVNGRSEDLQILQEGDFQIIHGPNRRLFDTLVYKVNEESVQLFELIETKASSMKGFNIAQAFDRMYRLLNHGIKLPDRTGKIRYFHPRRIYIGESMTVFDWSRLPSEAKKAAAIQRLVKVIYPTGAEIIEYVSPSFSYLKSSIPRSKIYELYDQLVLVTAKHRKWLQRMTARVGRLQEYRPGKEDHRKKVRFGTHVLKMTRHELLQCLEHMRALAS